MDKIKQNLLRVDDNDDDAIELDDDDDDDFEAPPSDAPEEANVRPQ